MSWVALLVDRGQEAPSDASQVLAIGRITREEAFLDDRPAIECDGGGDREHAVPQGRIHAEVPEVAEQVAGIERMPDDAVDAVRLDAAVGGDQPEAAPEGEDADRGIKTHGVYRVVRHPLYAGYLL